MADDFYFDLSDRRITRHTELRRYLSKNGWEFCFFDRNWTVRWACYNHPDSGLFGSVFLNDERNHLRVRMCWGYTPPQLAAMLKNAMILGEQMGCPVCVGEPYLEVPLTTEEHIAQVVRVHQGGLKFFQEFFRGTPDVSEMEGLEGGASPPG